MAAKIRFQVRINPENSPHWKRGLPITGRPVAVQRAAVLKRLAMYC